MRKNRNLYEIRNVEIIPNYTSNSDGSALIKFGNTCLLCTANIESGVPLFLKGKNSGWLTAEYSMLPGSTSSRSKREVTLGKQSGRTMEIQRLIGRSLRTALNFEAIGENTIKIDCDVLEADGGTRTCAITGGFVALYLCLKEKYKNNFKFESFFHHKVASISTGIMNDKIFVDLDYEEDSKCDVDMNLVMSDDIKIIEIQSSSEKRLHNIKQLNLMYDNGLNAINQLFKIQKKIIDKECE